MSFVGKAQLLCNKCMSDNYAEYVARYRLLNHVGAMVIS